jgi:hypothetical protein
MSQRYASVSPEKTLRHELVSQTQEKKLRPVLPSKLRQQLHTNKKKMQAAAQVKDTWHL